MIMDTVTTANNRAITAEKENACTYMCEHVVRLTHTQSHGLTCKPGYTQVYKAQKSASKCTSKPLYTTIYARIKHT